MLVPAVLIYSEEPQINTTTRNREFLKVQVGKCRVKVGLRSFVPFFFLTLLYLRKAAQHANKSLKPQTDLRVIRYLQGNQEIHVCIWCNGVQLSEYIWNEDYSF